MFTKSLKREEKMNKRCGAREKMGESRANLTEWEELLLFIYLFFLLFSKTQASNRRTNIYILV